MIPPGGAIAYSSAINGAGLAVCLGIIIRERQAQDILQVLKAPEKIMIKG